MLRSEWCESRLESRGGAIVALWLVCAALLIGGFTPAAAAQDFTLQAASFSPDAVAPGGTASAAITIGTSGASTTVNLSCTVSPSDASITDPPQCAVSPASVTTPATATATVTTKSDTTTQGYTVTITGTSSTSSLSNSPLPLTVLSVSPGFTITVTTTVAPSSVPAGNGAQGVITVNPINGYAAPTGGVTLACSSISPLVTIAPVCSFSYPPGKTALPISGTPASSTLTISTFGPVTTGANSRTRNIFAFWLLLPIFGFTLVGAALGRRRAGNAWAMLALVMLCGSIILVPGCGNSTSSTTTPNGVTPANTYTFTIVGVDSNGVVSSNTNSTTTSGPTVTLTVTAPSKTP